MLSCGLLAEPLQYQATRNPNMPLRDLLYAVKEYMIFVEQVRKYAAFLELNKAVKRAVSKCIRDGILSDFLSKHKVEIIAVNIFEYSGEREICLIRQKKYCYGIEQGQLNTLQDLVRK